MRNRRTTHVAFFALTVTLLCGPLGLTAQEDAAPTGNAVVQTKLAIELGAPFCDNMILQREMDVPVWGVAGTYINT